MNTLAHDGTSPKDILGLARAARKDGRFEEALAHYEYFFDHALDGDAHSLYGVRLSYCLAEWAAMGEQYPLARERLERRAETTRRELECLRRPESFHDLVSINKYLGRDSASLDVFLTYHDADRPFAESIVRYLWRQLIEDQQWEICAAYLPDPRADYRVAIERFDIKLSMAAEDAPPRVDQFVDRAKRAYIREVTDIGLVLVHANRHDELRQVLEQVEMDLASRQWPEMAEQIRHHLRSGPAAAGEAHD